MNKEKLTAIKNKIKQNAPVIVAYATAAAVTGFALYREKAYVTHEREMLDFIGKGPDFISIDQKLADRIENGETFGHDLFGGTRVLLSRAEPKNKD